MSDKVQVREITLEDDLDYIFGGVTDIAVDCETRGLNPDRDRLCVVSLYGDGMDFMTVLKIPNLNGSKLARDTSLAGFISRDDICPVFHNARFDMQFLARNTGVVMRNVYCTLQASRFARTYASGHRLVDLVAEFCGGTGLEKKFATTDWGGDLSTGQLRYCAGDVIHLHRIKRRLNEVLVREDLFEDVMALMDFIPRHVRLRLNGWSDEEILGSRPKSR